MSAPIRTLQRGATRAVTKSSAARGSRSGSASSSAKPIASSSSYSARSDRHDKLKRSKKDGILRKAVEMYHLTPSFLPSPQQASLTTSAGKKNTNTSSAWESALDNTIYSSILNTDSVSRRSPNLVPRGLSEYSREQSVRAASVSSFGNSEEMASSRSKDYGSFASDLTSTTFLTRREREAAAADQQSQLSKDSSSLQSSGSGLEHFTDADIAMYQRRHNHAAGAGASHGLDSSRYSGAERLTHLDRITPGGNEWYRSQGLDTRSARVRDAIFGTINGELPGLEVVRERIAKMRRGNPAKRRAAKQ
ncbi:hypothetical protein PSEUBRA_003595 [Kalmanozyma brasiliensis GHG001]|uniref:Uncharacterized protein n=1 Tax=Kalmanozyma brasiliensis (strain GHG001) TaxID=1365824 RepID=V5E9D5_KALBG|nr:uncharacterized protein PSEUBRA_003595 [Kalmanozyma brasiliensis GHG001]EST06966.1 hypothetical protein PSEUBRA_003595 [Kalmanozyma brasiliensis GHG001]